jgi:hypothetical protein
MVNAAGRVRLDRLDLGRLDLPDLLGRLDLRDLLDLLDLLDLPDLLDLGPRP